MRTIDWAVISAGVSARATKQVMESEQIARKEFMLKYIKGKLGSYNAAKVYMFGAADMTFFFNGDGDGVFSAPSGGLAFHNGEFYSVPIIASVITVSFGDALAIEVNTVAQAAMSIGGNVDIVFDYAIVPDSAGALAISDIVPLFAYEIITDWVDVPAASGATCNIKVKRIGNVCYLLGSGTVDSSLVLGNLPSLFIPDSNRMPEGRQHFVGLDVSNNLSHGYVFNGIVFFKNTGFLEVVNASYLMS